MRAREKKGELELLKWRTGDQKTRKGDVGRVSWVGAGAGGKRLLFCGRIHELLISEFILLQI